jgi:cytochrome c oxidase cbb3-type subunit 2
MNFFDDHRKLFMAALGLFLGLTIIVAILPALNNQKNNAPLPGAPKLSEQAMLGKQVYIANGCVACHTQQVRNVDMDKMWGDRPGIPADYAAITRTDFWRNTATLMGSERTGPDLTNIGKRQSSEAWNLLHLFQPRAVVKQSIMPAYPWLFVIKPDLEKGDVEVKVPEEFMKGINGKVVATQDALNLVAYLQSLKQATLPGDIKPQEFLYKKAEKPAPAAAAAGAAPAGGDPADALDGAALFTQNCAVCHQENGEGLPGAFPPLKGNSIVQGDDLEKYVSIIMLGYDASPEFAVMTPVGTDNGLTPEQVTAIMNHERTSWGNKGKKVSTDQVKKIMEGLTQTAKQ